MQEISTNVYIETSYEGVTLGALKWPHGLILLDSPFKQDDIRSWRANLSKLGSSGNQMLINMDCHTDRLLGVKAMECIVVAHDDVSRILLSRPATFKTIPSEMGCEWEKFDNLGNIRWSIPEFTFSDQFTILWDGSPINLISRPGCASGAIWVQLAEEKILFVGDCVVAHQPPYLNVANIPVWIQNLKEILSPMFEDYTIIGGRNGIVRKSDVENQIQFLDTVYHKLPQLAALHGNTDQIKKLAIELANTFPALDQYRKNINTNRLCFGLMEYSRSRYQTETETPA
jgi:glyoxylase-like metal-dependent hydrolase (beta-lactamase superfamily II)